MSKAPRPSVFDNIGTNLSPKAAPVAAPVPAEQVKPESEMFRTSLYLPRAVHDKLRDIAYHERKKMHELFVEGIDKVLAERGYPTIRELRTTKAL